MTPVTQTRFGAPTGNCTEACIASILEVGLDEVPSLWDPVTGEGHTQARWEILWGWLRARDHLFVWGDFSLRALPCPFSAVYPESDHWIRRLDCTGKYYMLGGPNPDGIPHWVVAKDGAIVWDPNPSQRGIVSADGIALLLPAEQAPTGLFAWAAHYI